MGKLVQVATNTVTSPTATVTLTGINSDDVYMVTYSGATPTTDDKNLYMRFTVSGTADSSANYDIAQKILKVDSAFSNFSATNQTSLIISYGVGSATGENANSIFYLYNFNNSSEYSFITIEPVYTALDNNAEGHTGGAVLTVAQACDGVQFFLESSDTFEAGTFTLYKVL
jgi:hypothetical protein